ncbi:MAG: hypothetical protein IKE24_01760 [Clostridia bacterium]|nr:hypothetical protein [Clostridia bacterium]
MKKEWMFLLPAAVLAVVLMAVLYSGLLRDRGVLDDLSRQLETSRTAWETTAEEKEKRQEELKMAEEALREAQLTLQESAERAETLKAEIAALEAENAGLEAKIGKTDRGAEASGEKDKKTKTK